MVGGTLAVGGDRLCLVVIFVVSVFQAYVPTRNTVAQNLPNQRQPINPQMFPQMSGIFVQGQIPQMGQVIVQPNPNAQLPQVQVGNKYRYSLWSVCLELNQN